MLAYIAKRILLMIPTLLGALTITFVVMQFVPGGPVEQILAEARATQKGGEGGGYKASRDIDKKQIEELKKLYGFDKPAHVRYVEMLGNFARFDLGRSFMFNKDVWQLIKEKLPVSISLGLWTFLISYVVSIPLGVAKAVREGSRFDIATTMVVLLGYAIRAVRARYPGRPVTAVFEPRSNTSRRRIFQREFSEALSEAGTVVVAGVFGAERFSPDDRLDPGEMVAAMRAAGREAFFIEEVDRIVDHLCAGARAGDLILIMSNGGFGGIQGKLARALEARPGVPRASGKPL